MRQLGPSGSGTGPSVSSKPVVSGGVPRVRLSSVGSRRSRSEADRGIRGQLRWKGFERDRQAQGEQHVTHGALLLVRESAPSYSRFNGLSARNAPAAVQVAHCKADLRSFFAECLGQSLMCSRTRAAPENVPPFVNAVGTMTQRMPAPTAAARPRSESSMARHASGSQPLRAIARMYSSGLGFTWTQSSAVITKSKYFQQARRLVDDVEVIPSANS